MGRTESVVVMVIEEEIPWGELDADAPVAAGATRRFAACSLDWDHIKAQDLLIVFNSFKGTSGVVQAVKVSEVSPAESCGL